MRLQVLVAIPEHPNNHPHFKEKCRYHADQLQYFTPDVDVHICIDQTVFPKGSSIFEAVGKARDKIILDMPSYITHVLWVDADIVYYAPDTLHRLLSISTTDIVAPLVLVEGKGIFYDVAAFIESGQPVYAKAPHFGNVLHKAPYFVSEKELVECDGVGCMYLIPADVYRQDDTPLHKPTPFTDHFPIIDFARRQLGVKAYCARFIPAYHADLPKYGLRWHQEPMDQWLGFDFAKYELKVKEGRRPDAGK